jgi:phosphoribosyl-ATP pyrophosphohydrolase/phosphoribosyl-AMP cyclohydrolase
VIRKIDYSPRARTQTVLQAMSGSITTEVKFDETGLVPAVVQDHATGEVLMLAYMNRESLSKTIESGETWFWSRSRGQLWHKGETSGNTQRVISIAFDCDGDTLLIRVEPRGPACHTGARSCFFRTT